MSASAEEAVLGGILMNPEMMFHAELTVDDFTAPERRALWQIMMGLANKGSPVDLVTVLDVIGETDDKTRKLTTDYCHQVYMAGSPANVPAYAALVKDASRKEKAKVVAQTLLASIDQDGPEAITQAVTQLMKLSAARKQYEWGIRQAVSKAIELIEAAEARGTAVEITTGLVDLDEYLGGWHKTDLSVIGARPAVGKTALLLNLADRAGAKCGIISAEQPHEQIGLRFLAMTGRVPLHSMRTATLSEDEYGRVSNAAAALSDRNIRIFDKSAPTLNDVVSQARRWRLEQGMEVLYLDYLQRIRYPDNRIPRHEQIMEIAMGLKELARELDIPIVALAQVNREVEKRADKRPTMADLRDSGSIEQEADQILTLYRDEVYNQDTPHTGVAEIVICKNRHGPVGTVKATWLGSFMRFENLARYGS